MSSHDASRPPFRSSVAPILHVVSVAFAFLLSRSVMSPLLLDIESTFGVSHSEVTRLFVGYTAGYAPSLIASSVVSRWLIHRRLILVATVLGAAGLLAVTAAGSLSAVVVGLATLGVGFGLFVPSGLAVITSAVEPHDWQKAMTIWELSPHLGMVLAPVLVLVLRPLLAWRWVYGILALLLLASGAMYAARVPATRAGGGNYRGRGLSAEAVGMLLRHPSFWLLILLFATALAAVDGIYLLIPTFLVAEAGMSATLANSLFSASRLMPIVALAAAAAVARRMGARRTVVLALVGAGIATTALAFLRGPGLVAAVFVQPSIGAIFFPAGLAALSALLPSESRNVGFSLVLPAAIVLGTGAMPALLGYLGDVATFARGFAIVGSVFILIGVCAAALRVD